MVNDLVAHKELLRRLNQEGAIKVEPPVHLGGRRRIDALLRDLVHRDASWIDDLANVMYSKLATEYSVGVAARVPLPFGLIPATIGIEPIVTYLVTMFAKNISIDFKIPMPAALSRVRNGLSEVRIYGGGPWPDYRFALLDDISRQGTTIIQALRFWLERGFNVNRVIVFTDRGEGGLERIMDAAEDINRSRGPHPIKVMCIFTPEEILSVIDEP